MGAGPNGLNYPNDPNLFGAHYSMGQGHRDNYPSNAHPMNFAIDPELASGQNGQGNEMNALAAAATDQLYEMERGEAMRRAEFEMRHRQMMNGAGTGMSRMSASGNNNNNNNNSSSSDSRCAHRTVDTPSLFLRSVKISLDRQRARPDVQPRPPESCSGPWPQGRLARWARSAALTHSGGRVLGWERSANINHSSIFHSHSNIIIRNINSHNKLPAMR